MIDGRLAIRAAIYSAISTHSSTRYLIFGAKRTINYASDPARREWVCNIQWRTRTSPP